MATQPVQWSRENQDATSLSHSEKQIAIFPIRARLPVPSNGIKGSTQEHDRAVREWRHGSTPKERGSVPGANNPAARVDRLRERADQAGVGVGLQDLQLAPEPVRMRDVIRIHAGTDGRSSLSHDSIGTADHAQPVQAGVDSNPVVACCPLTQDAAGLIGRTVIQNDELKILEGLANDALNAFLQVVFAVVDRHYNAKNRFLSLRRHTMTPHSDLSYAVQ